MNRRHFLLLGPLAAIAVRLLLAHHGALPATMAGLVAWMAVWWISEAVPIAITSLLPLVVLPFFGVADVGSTAANYGKEIIFLFLGGFLLALGIESSGLHRRIALHIVLRLGGSASRLVLGVMAASAFLSMWINSTAAVLVLLPIALSLVDGLSGEARSGNLAIPMLLGVSYGATIGGMATPVGTPPNLVLMQLWSELFPELPRLGFGQWMAFALPFSVVFLLIAWLLLVRVIFPQGNDRLAARSELRERLHHLGPMERDERWTGLLFACTALLWVTGDGLELGPGVDLPGWRELTGAEAVTDAAVAVGMAILLFVLPSGKGKSRRLLAWDDAEKRVPWGVLLLIGSGFALAMGIERSGLDQVLAQGIVRLSDLHPALMLFGLVLVVMLLSELGSNTATAALVLPILARSADAMATDPVLLLVPATLAASLGFMLPIASPMHTIVFATGRIPVRTMVRAGVWMDLLGAMLLVGTYLLLGRLVFAA
ncbi:MAG: SLC13/DASS family transporter [Flavobacteriales bacterium]|nr:SLC13/DASS family transporter [Flavobacteriales bacterium]